MAVLNIYKDCSSEEPTNKSECRRILYGVAMKTLAIGENMQEKSESEQFAMIGEIIKTIFPKITDEELLCTDIAELKAFCRDIFSMAAHEVDKAQKN